MLAYCVYVSKVASIDGVMHFLVACHCTIFIVHILFCYIKKVKVAHTRLPSVGYRSWSRFLAVSLQVTWFINLAVGCHYFPPGLQLPSQPLRGLLIISLLGEQRHDWCEQFAYYCYPTVSRLRFEGPSASSMLTTRLPSHPYVIHLANNFLSLVSYTVSAIIAHRNACRVRKQHDEDHSE